MFRNAPIDLPITVAQPAPTSPIAGTGPKPNMNMGSSMMFATTEIARFLVGVTVSPPACMMPWDRKPKKRNMNPMKMRLA